MNLLNSTPNEAQANFLRSKLINILTEQLGNGKEIKDSDNFIDNLYADSIDQVEIVMAIEDEFMLEFTNEEANEMVTLDVCMRILHTRAPESYHSVTYKDLK